MKWVEVKDSPAKKKVKEVNKICHRKQGSSCILVYETEAKGYGLGSTTPDVKVLPFNSESLGYSANIISSEAINNTRNRSKPGRGNKSIEGDITTELNPYMATLFKHLLGKLTTTVSSAKYTHTIKVGDLRPTANWAIATVYAVNDMVYPTTANRNAHAYICTVAGTSHAATEPTWPTAEAGTVTDGTMTWKEYTVESLVFEKQFLNLATPQYFKYVGNKFNSGRMSFRSEGLIPTVFNILGKSEVIATSGMILLRQIMGMCLGIWEKLPSQRAAVALLSAQSWIF